MSYAKEMFDLAINTQPGEKIAIPCKSAEHMNSVRTLICRERVKFVEATNPDYDIIIQSKTVEGKFFVLLSKTEPLEAPFLINKEGEITKRFIITRGPAIKYAQEQDAKEALLTAPYAPAVSPEAEHERMTALMRQDGMSEEEISTYWGEDSPDKLSIIDVSDEKEDERDNN
jgi:hypothetical protein